MQRLGKGCGLLTDYFGFCGRENVGKGSSLVRFGSLKVPKVFPLKIAENYTKTIPYLSETRAALLLSKIIEFVPPLIGICRFQTTADFPALVKPNK